MWTNNHMLMIMMLIVILFHCSMCIDELNTDCIVVTVSHRAYSMPVAAPGFFF